MRVALPYFRMKMSRLTAFVTCIISMSALAAQSSPNWTLATASIREFQLSPGSNPPRITAGADGNLWFTAQQKGIGRITPSGSISEFPMPNTYPWQIRSAPDGNLWYSAAFEIGKVTLSGTRSRFQLNGPIEDIAVDRNGNIWFLADSFFFFGAVVPQYVGRMTPAGVIAEFQLPPSSIILSSEITSAPDGTVWFTEYFGSKIGRITTDDVVSEFGTPTPEARPSRIAVSDNGNVWFAESNLSRIVRVSPQLVFTEFQLPDGGPYAVTVGPDKNIWFSQFDAIGFITTDGKSVTTIPLPPGMHATDIASGPDSNIWFTDLPGNAIGRLDVASITPAGNIPTLTAFALGLLLVALCGVACLRLS